MAANAEYMGKRLRDEIAGFNSPLVTEIRGKGLLNAIVIDESLGKNASADGFAWDICVDMAHMGMTWHLIIFTELRLNSFTTSWQLRRNYRELHETLYYSIKISFLLIPILINL